MYLRHRARVEDMRKFLKLFSRHDYVANDHKVGQMLKRLIEKDLSQEESCPKAIGSNPNPVKLLLRVEFCTAHAHFLFLFFFVSFCIKISV